MKTTHAILSCEHKVAQPRKGKLSYRGGVTSVDKESIVYNSKIILSSALGVYFCEKCGVTLDQNGKVKL